MLKKLFYASASILMLALAYHFGATSAGAQSGGNVVVNAFAGGGAPISMNGGAVTAAGDVYVTGDWVTWTRLSNVFTGAATPAAQQTFGQVKAQYRK